MCWYKLHIDTHKHNNNIKIVKESAVEAAIDDFTIQVFSSTECSTGDLNGDELINVQDVVTMVNIVLGPIDDLYEYLCVADLNQDDTINVQDIILLVNLILT